MAAVSSVSQGRALAEIRRKAGELDGMVDSVVDAHHGGLQLSVAAHGDILRMFKSVRASLAELKGEVAEASRMRDELRGGGAETGGVVADVVAAIRTHAAAQKEEELLQAAARLVRCLEVSEADTHASDPEARAARAVDAADALEALAQLTDDGSEGALQNVRNRCAARIHAAVRALAEAAARRAVEGDEDAVNALAKAAEEHPCLAAAAVAAAAAEVPSTAAAADVGEDASNAAADARPGMLERVVGAALRASNPAGASAEAPSLAFQDALAFTLAAAQRLGSADAAAVDAALAAAPLLARGDKPPSPSLGGPAPAGPTAGNGGAPLPPPVPFAFAL